jgi:signal peptidase I
MNIYGIVFWVLVGLGAAAAAFGRYKLYEKAQQPSWAAFVPIYNQYVKLQIIGKPIWWFILLFVPVIGVLVWVAMVIEFAKAYGKHKLGEHAAALLIPFYFFPKTGLDEKVQYLGPPDQQKKAPKKSGLREWGDAILFAGVAALIIRTLFIEAFMIPTSSMEGTLLAGDFLFVSKYKYGARLPMVPLSVPFIHNKISLGNTTFPSYLGFLELPYYRLPGYTSIERNDIVVFNYPAHDISDLGDGAGLVEEISMKENYIKRCVGMPGDELEVRAGQVYINGEPGTNPSKMQFMHQVQTSQGFNYDRQLLKLGFRDGSSTNINWRPDGQNLHYMWMTEETSEKVKALPQVKSVEPQLIPNHDQHLPGTYPGPKYNPGGKYFKNNVDNYGPITIPAEGMTVALTPENLALYRRCIEAYEGHELEENNGKVLIDGVEASDYTFEMDYYWMMGDNRHNSQDSRFWGFVPENHIVGTPLFVFMSYESFKGQNFFENIRWSRIGRKFLDN